jgi:hypothetical protein
VVTRECYLSCMILRGSDNSRFYQVKTNLQNDMTKGTTTTPRRSSKLLASSANTRCPQGTSVPDSRTAREQHSCKAAEKRSLRLAQLTAGIMANWGTTKQAELQIEGVQNLNIEDCVQEHSLFLADNDYKMFQREKKVIMKEMRFPRGERGIHGILSPHHVYIDTCATFTSTPYPHLLTNLKKEERALMGQSNMGSGGMEMSGEIGAVDQMWLNKGGVATIIPLKVLKKIWPVTYDSRRNGGPFVIHADQGNIIVKNNSKGMPYLDIRDMEAEVVLLFIQTMIGAVEAADGLYSWTILVYSVDYATITLQLCKQKTLYVLLP